MCSAQSTLLGCFVGFDQWLGSMGYFTFLYTWSIQHIGSSNPLILTFLLAPVAIAGTPIATLAGRNSQPQLHDLEITYLCSRWAVLVDRYKMAGHGSRPQKWPKMNGNWS